MEIQGSLKQGARLFRNYHLNFFRNYRVGLITTLTGDQFFKTGAGKSTTGLKFGELIDNDFNVDKSTLSPREFLKQVDLVSDSEKPEQVVIMDEGAIAAPSSTWYSVTNKAIFYSMVTFRHLRSMAILITPAFSWIDKRLRILTNHWGYMTPHLRAKHYKNSHGNVQKDYMLSYFQVRTDLWGDKIFFKKPRYYDTDARRVSIAQQWKIGEPSQDLMDAYEKKSNLFKAKIRKSFMVDIEKFEKDAGLDEQVLTNQDIIEAAMKNEYVMEELRKKGRVSKSTLINALEDDNIHIAHTKGSWITKQIGRVWNGGQKG